MIRHGFDYVAPETVEEATAALDSADGETAVIAGGTWVVVEMNQGARRPSRVVDLRRTGLDQIQASGGTTKIGATATYSGVLASDAPAVLKTMARGITGGGQLRNRATLGGSACYANPASDVPGVLVGLDATLTLESSAGPRDVPAASFFLGAFESDVRPGEVLTGIDIPAAADGSRTGYVKFKLCESSWPIVTATCVVGSDGKVERLAIGGAQAVPLLVEGAVGADDADAVAAAAAGAVTEPWSDVLAPGSYRRSIVPVIAKRAFAEANAGG